MKEAHKAIKATRPKPTNKVDKPPKFVQDKIDAFKKAQAKKN